MGFPTESSKLESLIDAGIAIAAGLDLDTTLLRLVETGCRLTSARYGALGVLDEGGGHLARFVTHGVDDATRRAIGGAPTGRGILGVLIADARPLRLADLTTDPRSVGFPAHHPPMSSFLGVPVKAGGSVFGNLYLTEKAEGEFTDEDERLTNLLAAQAGVAIQNARLFASVREHAEALEHAMSDLSSVHEINEAILSGRPIENVLQLIAEQAQLSLRADVVLVGLIDPNRETIRFEAVSGETSRGVLGMTIPVAGSKAGAVMQAKRSVRVDDMGSDAQAYAPAVADLGIRSAAMSPMVYRDQAMGVVIAHRERPGDEFDDNDLHVLELFAARATLALGMARAVTGERERASAELALASAEQREEARRDTLRRVVEAQELERRRIARELHDDTGQSLATVLMGLRVAEQSTDPAEARATIADLRETVTGAIRDLRSLAVELRPTALDDFGLAAALERLVDTFARRTGLAIDLHVTGLDERLREEVETALYRIVQETLTNTAKHAGATRVSVIVRRVAARVVMVVEDDGRGFDPDGAGRGLGLVSIRERAELVGGNVRFESAPGQGVTVAVEVPV